MAHLPEETPPVAQLIEASLEELLELRQRVRLQWAPRLYADLMIAYLSHDAQGLQSVQEQIHSSEIPERELFAQIATLRRAIRSRENQEIPTDRLQQLSEKYPQWMGEIEFLLGIYADIRGAPDKAEAHFLRARPELLRVGAKRKALKALFNALASRSKIEPERIYFVDNHALALEARQLGEPALAGQALQAISREFELLGCMRTALKYANSALETMEPVTGTSDYFNALAHRCFLSFSLSRTAEGEMDWERLELSPFPESRACIEVIEVLQGMRAEITEASLRILSASWKQRLADLKKKGAVGLSEIEEHLIELLSRGHQSRNFLVDQLFGTQLEFDTRLERFKVFLMRLRKKRPHLIECEDGKYFLNENVRRVPQLEGNAA